MKPMNLAHLLEWTDSTQLEAELLRTLTANPDWIPTEKACERGWPRAVVAERVRELCVEAERIGATVDVSFTECFGTGCSETFEETPRWIECRLHIARQTGVATINVISDDSPDAVDS